MTYNVFSGTLNPTQSLYEMSSSPAFRRSPGIHWKSPDLSFMASGWR